MIKSMTGFGTSGIKALSKGRCSVEIRSINHKFLETVLHIPEGFLSLEGNIKNVIENKISRGRINCVISISGISTEEVVVNERLLEKYIFSAQKIKKHYRIADQVSINTLINLPGVLSLSENNRYAAKIWPELSKLVNQALVNLIRMRLKEGRALHGYLKLRLQDLEGHLSAIKQRFKKAVKEKCAAFKTDEERSAFLKNSDISEEIIRLSFHVKNFKSKLNKVTPIGKELDFISQEMQRETNTIGAKSFDTVISGKVIEIKSQIEKIREQVQNIE